MTIPRLTARARLHDASTPLGHFSCFLMGCLVGLLSGGLLLGLVSAISIKQNHELKDLWLRLITEYQTRQILPNVEWPCFRTIESINQAISGKAIKNRAVRSQAHKIEEWTDVGI